mgnify:CR=1 FL=1
MRRFDNIVQLRNPRLNRYVKIDRVNGKILSVKKTKGPYKNIQIIGKRRKHAILKKSKV